MSVAQQIAQWFRGLFQWWVIVAPWEQGVRVRCGKRVKLLVPGMHLKLPVIDAVFVQPIRARAQHVRSQTVTTRDGKAVSLAGALQFQVADLLKLYQTLHSAFDTIEQLCQGVVSKYIYSTTLAELKQEDLEKRVLDEVNLAQYGIDVLGFAITSFAVVKTYRLISGEMGLFGYDDRIDTSRAVGDEGIPR